MTTLPSILTWPRLPNRSFSEHWFVQSAIGFPGLVVDALTEQVYVDRTRAEQELDRLSLAYLRGNQAAGAMGAESASGLFELLRVPKDWFKGVAITSQLVGPVSLGVYLTDEQQRSLIYDPILLEALAHLLALRIGWVTGQLANLVEQSIFCLDEPFLDAFNSPFLPIGWDRGIELLELVLSSASGYRGIALGKIGNWQQMHRTPVYWEPVLETSVNLLMFNVYDQSDVLLDGANVLKDFLDRPGLISWGLIPANEQSLAKETTDTLTARFNGLLRRLNVAGVPRDRLLQASLITTSGRLSHLSIEAAERALQLCSDVSLRIRLSYGLTNQ